MSLDTCRGLQRPTEPRPHARWSPGRERVRNDPPLKQAALASRPAAPAAASGQDRARGAAARLGPLCRLQPFLDSVALTLWSRSVSGPDCCLPQAARAAELEYAMGLPDWTARIAPIKQQGAGRSSGQHEEFPKIVQIVAILSCPAQR